MPTYLGTPEDYFHMGFDAAKLGSWVLQFPEKVLHLLS
jgi:hypothetical protein